jgi:peptidylprolyl isomerase
MDMSSMKRFFLLVILFILANICKTEATEEICNSLARISHTFSGQIAALPIEIASQVGEDSVHATRPRPLKRQDHRAGCASCQRKCEKCGLDERQQISFYRGYLLWQEYLKKPGIPYDFEQLIAGMRAAQNGENLSCDEDNLQKKIIEFQENLHAKQVKENLIDAEAFLSKIVQEGALELVPNKLYYKTLKIGEGKKVQPVDVPMLTYTVWTYNRWGEQEVISFDTPHPVMLEDTIPGFAQGVTGMLEGEIRQLFIHPDLAYGTYGKFDPNLLIIFKVEVVSKDAKGETH